MLKFLSFSSLVLTCYGHLLLFIQSCITIVALESLEADNFHDDPHADLVMSKKALNLFQEVQHGTDSSSTSATNVSGSQAGTTNPSSTSSKASKRRLKTAEYYKQR